MLSFIKSRIFLINLALAVIFIAVLIAATYNWLDSYTRHGETITVPDIRGMEPDLLKTFLENKKVRAMVIDSSMYDPKKPWEVILEQEPPANSKVKENRTLYLYINSRIPTQVKMPDLTDVSYRQAEAILESYGLKVGETIYKPDLAKDAVLTQLYKGIPIKAGSAVPKGSSIDLILGDGYGNTRMSIPNLVGLSLEQALFVLKASSLNQGQVIPDLTVKDNNAAIVYQQIPAYNPDSAIRQGEAINLYITQKKQ